MKYILLLVLICGCNAGEKTKVIVKDDTQTIQTEDGSFVSPDYYGLGLSDEDIKNRCGVVELK